MPLRIHWPVHRGRPGHHGALPARRPRPGRWAPARRCPSAPRSAGTPPVWKTRLVTGTLRSDRCQVFVAGAYAHCWVAAPGMRDRDPGRLGHALGRQLPRPPRRSSAAAWPGWRRGPARTAPGWRRRGPRRWSGTPPAGSGRPRSTTPARCSWLTKPFGPPVYAIAGLPPPDSSCASTGRVCTTGPTVSLSRDWNSATYRGGELISSTTMSARSSPRGAGVEPTATASTGRRCTVALTGTPVSGAGTPTGATAAPDAAAVVVAGPGACGAVRGAGSGAGPAAGEQQPAAGGHGRPPPSRHHCRPHCSIPLSRWAEPAPGSPRPARPPGPACPARVAGLAARVSAAARPRQPAAAPRPPAPRRSASSRRRPGPAPARPVRPGRLTRRGRRRGLPPRPAGSPGG